MSQENTQDFKEGDYWRGRYEEAKSARDELEELMKLLIVQGPKVQAQQQPSVSSQTTQPANSSSLTGKGINIQMGNILGVMPSLLMFLFGVYGTTTGADIGITMIIIGAIFGVVFAFYLLSRTPSPRRSAREIRAAT